MWLWQRFRDAGFALRGVRPLQWFFLLSAAVTAVLGYSLQQRRPPPGESLG